MIQRNDWGYRIHIKCSFHIDWLKLYLRGMSVISTIFYKKVKKYKKEDLIYQILALK